MTKFLDEAIEFLKSLKPRQAPGDIILLDVRKSKMGNKLKAKFAVPPIPEGYVGEVKFSRFGVKLNGGEEAVTDVPTGTPFFEVTFDPPAALDITLVLVDDEGLVSEHTKTAHYDLADTVKPPDAGDIAAPEVEEVPGV